MKLTFLLLLFVLACVRSYGQARSIDARINKNEVRSRHLRMGGANPNGDEIAINNRYLSVNGKPSIPITGEFHFSRYPNASWNEAIRKIKAGGIDIIATYVFWNMHEEHEGEFNWTNDNNLRKFIELCAANDVKVVLRIGPFCHGEIRNGGLPDWLLGKLLTVRSNDPEYLKHVDRLYRQIGGQVEGLLFKDGGPIFAIQLENEYQHSAAPWGLTYPGQPHDWTSSDQDKEITQEGVGISEKENPYAELGNQHMAILKSLAEKNGLIAPIYTATGWGNAAIIENETQPVTAAYPYPAWAPAQPSDFYLYKDLQKAPDYAPVRYKPDDYPYFAAEMGGGMMTSYSRRPVVPAKSLEALVNRFLGSGANGIGYYMYHGGITPKGDDFFFNDEAYGYPKMSYDYQAPLSAYGKPSESFNRLKILHYFIHGFEEILAPMQLVLPVEPSTIDLKADDQVRYSMRSNGEEAFLFLNNFQDHRERKDLENLQFNIQLNGGRIQIPESGGFGLKKDENAILPVNMPIGLARLNYATAQVLAKGRNRNGQFYVFFAPEGIRPEFSIAASEAQTITGINCNVDKNAQRILVTSDRLPFEISIQSKDETTRILVIDKPSALNCWKIRNGTDDFVLIADAMVLGEKDRFELISRASNTLEIQQYPASGTLAAGRGKLTQHPDPTGFMASYRLELDAVSVELPVRRMGPKMAIDLSGGLPEGVNDIICRINYTGDTAQGFIDGKLAIDAFYNGIPWEIGLRDYLNRPDAREMVFYFRPMHRGAEFLQDLAPDRIPEFDEHGQFLKIGESEFFAEYKVNLHFQ